MDENEFAASMFEEFATRLRVPKVVTGTIGMVGTAAGGALAVVLGAETHAADPVPGHSDFTVTSYQGGHVWSNTGTTEQSVSLAAVQAMAPTGSTLGLFDGSAEYATLTDPVSFPVGFTITGVIR